MQWLVMVGDVAGVVLWVEVVAGHWITRCVLHKVMVWPQCLWILDYLLWSRHKVIEWPQYTDEFMKADCRNVLQWVHRQQRSSYTKCTMNNHMYHWDWLNTEFLICTGAGGVGCTEVTGVILGRVWLSAELSVLKQLAWDMEQWQTLYTRRVWKLQNDDVGWISLQQEGKFPWK